jgi:dihydroxyacetone kinase-like predicted kinase
MVAAAESGLYKVHLHAKHPEAVFARLAPLGEITWKKVDDMEKPHRHAFRAE